MLKNIKSGLHHIKPKNIHLLHQKGSKGGGDATESTHGDEENSQGAPAPPNVAVGPKAVPPPGTPQGKLPPGAVVKTISSGSGAVSPPRPGTKSPMTQNPHGTPPSGMKLMAFPPPGAKMISGALPPGVKVLQGGPPPGAKVIQGSPPPGAKVMRGSLPPGAKIMQGSPPPAMKVMHGAPPPGVKVVLGAPPPGAKLIPGSPLSGTFRPMSPSIGGPAVTPPLSTPLPPSDMTSKTSTKVAPSPGMKLIHGALSPGSRSLSPENARTLTGSPPLTPSRNVSPTGPPVFRILPNGVKVIAGPPPENAMVKTISKTPPSGTLSPSPPIKSPPKKMLIKTMPMNKSPPPITQGPNSHITSLNASQFIPQNNSFSVGPPPQPSQANQNLPRPTPVRPAVSLVPADGPGSAADTNSSLPVPHPKVVSSRSGSLQDLNFKEEDDTTNASNGDDIKFEEGTLSSPPQASQGSGRTPPAPRARSNHSSSFSSTSSVSIKADTDEATALPPAKKGAQAPSSSAASIRSSQQAKEVSEAKAKERKKRKSHHTSSSASGAVAARDDNGNGKATRKHRHHHHHRSRSSGASSQRPYRVPGVLESCAASTSAEDEAHRHTTPRQGKKTLSDADDSGSRYGAQLSEAAFTPQALTSTSRNRIAEDFLSMLCPQQYYGKVKKINHIRPFKANRAAVTGLRGRNSIYVATKGTMPNPYFYPQLRLRDTDGEQPRGVSGDDTVDGAVDTPIILYEAAPGNMLFAETELDARHLLESSPNANSCFVLNNSAILFKDPEHYVVPIASLNVHWVPYASPHSEPQCSIHKRELQLFDPYSKELVCALCASRNGIPMSNFVVIPDVLGNADSRQTIQAKVSSQLDEAQESARRWVEQHQRIQELCENKKSAIGNQFNLLIEALEAKKKEYIEACEAEFAYAQTDVAREILITDEKVQLLKAAFDHLRTDPSRPLFSMQIATIAEGLSATTEFPSRFTRNSLQLPPMSAGLVPNLEGIMTEVLELSPSGGVNDNGIGGGVRSRPCSNSQSHSPYNSRRAFAVNNSRRPIEDTVDISGGGGPRQRSGYLASPGPSVTLQRPLSRSVSASQLNRMAPLRNSTLSLAPAMRDESSRLSNSLPTHKRSVNGLEPPSAYATDAVSVPNSTGTSLFDFPLHDLLRTFDSSNVKKRSPRYIQWAMRVEDPGDWVGLGVGVGNTIDAWEKGSTNDLSHLWIVPASMTGNVLYLRVMVQPSSGHAKLTVHDIRGKQLDAGEVPQWNAARPSYPQATFGGYAGTVRMIEVPHAVR